MDEGRRRRLLIECTVTLLDGGHTGCQRVTRALAKYGEEVGGSEFEVVPVVWTPLGFITAREASGLYRRLRARRREVKATGGGEGGSGTIPVRSAWKTRVHEWMTLVGFPGSLVGRHVVPGRGDVLLLADSSWHLLGLYDDGARLRERGVTVGSVVYDLFPLTNPEWCDDALVGVFRAWADACLPRIDFAMCISRATEGELRRELAKRGIQGVKTGAFDLGADMEEVSGEVREEVKAFFAGGRTVLQVGTIEPRKAHGVTLGAVERLWAKGVDVKLAIVGGRGWKSGALMARLEGHAERGRRLGVWHRLSDAEIDWCYREAGALVCPSLGEGYGLPLAEGLARGARVVASDLAVHREVGGEACLYFPVGDSAELGGVIEKVLAQGASGRVVVQRRSWREATRGLVEGIVRLV